MARRLRRSRGPLLAALPWTLAVLVALGGWRLSHALDGEPVDLSALALAPLVTTAALRAEERAWIDAALPERALPKPVVELPCPVGLEAARPFALRLSDALDRARRFGDAGPVAEVARDEPWSWVPALALGTFLAREGKLSEAATVLGELFARPEIQAAVRETVQAAAEGKALKGPPTEEVRGLVHLLHAYGTVLVETQRGGDDLWTALKNPIGAAKLLSLRGETDRLAGMPTWAEHRLSAPGCAPGLLGLTTLDLYNNLVVGYLDHADFQDLPERLRRELDRDHDPPPEVDPLLAALRAAEAAGLPEHRLWALSNAERLLEQRRESGSGEIANVHLAFNLAALMASVFEITPAAARPALAREEEQLLAVALAGRADVPPAQQRTFRQGLARLLLLAAVRSGDEPALPDDVAAVLEPAQAETVARLAAARIARRPGDDGLPAVWRASAAELETLRGALGPRAEPWLAAARHDLATTLATGGRAARTRGQKIWWAEKAHQALLRADPLPPELEALDGELGFAWRLAPQRWLSSRGVAVLLALLGAFLAWIFGGWAAIQVQRWRDLFTSFYRLEARERLRRSP